MQDNTEGAQGCCPVCGSENLSYGKLQGCETGICYPWICDDCGSSGKECYSISFDSHQEIVKKNAGKKE